MIELTLKKRTVVHRGLVRVDANSDLRQKFNDIDADFLVGIPITGIGITLASVLAFNVIFGGQNGSSLDRREETAWERRGALLARMYEGANDKVRLAVAKLYDTAKADGVISGMEFLQVQDAMIVAGRERVVEGPALAPVPVSQAEMMQVAQWLSTGDEAVRERAREALSDQVLDRDEFAAIEALKSKP